MVEFISNLCRVCLSDENELMEIDSEFIIDEKPFHLETVLVQIGGIKMKKNSELPSSICSSCLDEAIAASSFRQKCRNSDRILQNFLKQACGLGKSDNHTSGSKRIPVNQELSTKVGVKKESGSRKTAIKKVKESKLSLNDDVLVTSVDDYFTVSVHPTEHCYERNVTSYSCLVCHMVFIDESMLLIHLREEHCIAQYQCKLCSELFSTSVEVHIHMSEHKQTTTGVKQEIQSELVSHHDDDDNTGKQELVCHICGKVYKDKTCMLKHIHLHQTGRIHSSYVCDYCGKGFRTHTKLRIHISGLHLNIRPYPCSMCEKRFKTKRDRRRHYWTHSKIRTFFKKKHTCSICGVGLVNSAALIQHERAHNNDRPFKCDECGRGFVCLGRRNTHKITAHTKPTKKCPNCPALFHLNSMVNTHIKKVHLKANRRRKPYSITRQYTGDTES